MQREKLEFSAVITKEGKWYVALCPELDIASQGKTVEKALSNLKEALELYLADQDVKLPENQESPIVTIIKVQVVEKTFDRIRK
ncbi:MAG: type II toxin-antitoxin system HicB family antitoxin [Nitrososphaerales archaeon]